MMSELQDYLTKVETIGLDPELLKPVLATRRIGGSIIAPVAKSVDEDRRFPQESMDALHAEGLTTLYVPQARGGAGLDPVTSMLPHVLIAMELSAWCSSTGQVYGAHVSVQRQLGMLASEDMKQFFDREALEGRYFASLGAEPGANRFAIGSRLEKCGADYRLNGRKQFATSSTGSAWAMWMSITPDDAIILPMVNLRAPGITVVDNWEGVGQRGTGSGIALAENAPVVATHIMETNHPAFRLAYFENVSNLIFAAQFVGIATGAYRAALGYVRERTRPWRGVESPSQDPYIRLRVADMAIKINAARQLVIHAARVFEHGAMNHDADMLTGVAVAQAKIMATETALEVTTNIFQVMGASSATTTHGFDRYFRDARTLTLHDPVDRRRELVGMYELGSTEGSFSIAPSAPVPLREPAA